jgi:hypothetical protein
MVVTRMQASAKGSAMTKIEFTYKGKRIAIRDEHPNAVVQVEGRGFTCHHHHEKDGKGLAMWMCVESYFASPDIRELARHFVDYAYLFDAEWCVRVDDDGNVIERGAEPTSPTGGHTGHRGGK